VAFTLSRKDGNSAFYTTKVKSGKKVMQLKRVTLNNKLVLNNVASLSDVFASMALSDKTSRDMITVVADESVNKQEAKVVEIPAKQAAISGGKTGVTQQTQVKKIETPSKKPVTEPPSQVKPAGSKVGPAKVVTSEASVKKDVVVYRVYAENRTTLRLL